MHQSDDARKQPAMKSIHHNPPKDQEPQYRGAIFFTSFKSTQLGTSSTINHHFCQAEGMHRTPTNYRDQLCSRLLYHTLPLQANSLPSTVGEIIPFLSSIDVTFWPRGPKDWPNIFNSSLGVSTDCPRQRSPAQRKQKSTHFPCCLSTRGWKPSS